MRIEIENEFVFIDELAWKHGGKVTISVDNIDRFAIEFSKIGSQEVVQHDLLRLDGTVIERITTTNEEED
jgi:hypothetical protein